MKRFPTPIEPENIHQLIAERIHDTQLRANVERATRTSLVKRDAVVSDYADWEEMRSVAHDIKRHVLDHAGEYLARFEQKATDAGAQVHFATDAADAAGLVCDIAARHGRRVAVKSKSMTGEEIDLTHAMERAGLETIETDLGEYIIQLAGEPPSHITAPALHKSRGEIGLLFAEKLGIEFSDDPEQLTNVARGVLREDFLRADVGVSGVNFAIAESGSICIVENEGNARLSTTLPKVHIAVMGFEKLLPDFESLALFLNMLGRSATGQRITCYTSILTGPRNGKDERDGPDGTAYRRARQRTHTHAGRPETSRCAALHPLRGVHERVSGVSENRRSRLRIDLSRAHRQRHHSRVSRRGSCGRHALRFLTVRRLRVKSVPSASTCITCCSSGESAARDGAEAALFERLYHARLRPLSHHARCCSISAVACCACFRAMLRERTDADRDGKAAMRVPIWSRDARVSHARRRSFKQLWREKREREGRHECTRATLRLPSMCDQFGANDATERAALHSRLAEP
jgi:hypothetical protein